MTEIPLEIPLYDKLVTDIKAKPAGELVIEKLSPADLKGVLGALLAASANYPGLRVQSGLDVKIEKQRGLVKGSIGIDHTALGHSDALIDLTFTNNPSQQNTIITERINVQPHLSMRAKLALGAKGIDLDKELKNKLSNPQKSLFDLMSGQLRQKGLILDKFGATFSQDNNLLLGFRCKRA